MAFSSVMEFQPSLGEDGHTGIGNDTDTDTVNLVCWSGVVGLDAVGKGLSFKPYCGLATPFQ